jgi:hypothetical protein
MVKVAMKIATGVSCNNFRHVPSNLQDYSDNAAIKKIEIL